MRAAAGLAADARDTPTCCPGSSQLTIDERREIVEVFFLSHPGPGRRGLGLGRAVADFVEWEASSGRLDEASGSPWWQAVNESFVVDLRSTFPAGVHSGPTRAGPTPSAAWVAYVAAGEASQQALWAAHQQSLMSAVDAARPLLDLEPPEERVFIGIVLAVVGRAAADNLPTDTIDLARSTRRLYPASYPILRPQLDELTSKLIRARAADEGHEGTR